MSNELRDINLLFPPLAEQVYKFDKEVKERFGFYIFETLRPIEKQKENYTKGREKQNGVWVVVDKKAVITNAKPGLSFHGFGLAFDDVPDGNPGKEGVQWSWEDYDLSKPDKQMIPWRDVSIIAKNYGFEWAGYWTSFPEMPHYQKTYGFKAQELLTIFNNNGMNGVWKTIEKSIAKVTSSVQVGAIPELLPVKISTEASGISGRTGVSEAAKFDKEVFPVTEKLVEYNNSKNTIPPLPERPTGKIMTMGFEGFGISNLIKFIGGLFGKK